MSLNGHRRGRPSAVRMRDSTNDTDRLLVARYGIPTTATTTTTMSSYFSSSSSSTTSSSFGANVAPSCRDMRAFHSLLSEQQRAETQLELANGHALQRSRCATKQRVTERIVAISRFADAVAVAVVVVVFASDTESERAPRQQPSANSRSLKEHRSFVSPAIAAQAAQRLRHETRWRPLRHRKNVSSPSPASRRARI